MWIKAGWLLFPMTTDPPFFSLWVSTHLLLSRSFVTEAHFLSLFLLSSHFLPPAFPSHLYPSLFSYPSFPYQSPAFPFPAFPCLSFPFLSFPFLSSPLLAFFSIYYSLSHFHSPSFPLISFPLFSVISFHFLSFPVPFINFLSFFLISLSTLLSPFLPFPFLSIYFPYHFPSFHFSPLISSSPLTSSPLSFLNVYIFDQLTGLRRRSWSHSDHTSRRAEKHEGHPCTFWNAEHTQLPCSSTDSFTNESHRSADVANHSTCVSRVWYHSSSSTDWCADWTRCLHSNYVPSVWWLTLDLSGMRLSNHILLCRTDSKKASPVLSFRLYSIQFQLYWVLFTCTQLHLHKTQHANNSADVQLSWGQSVVSIICRSPEGWKLKSENVLISYINNPWCGFPRGHLPSYSLRNAKKCWNDISILKKAKKNVLDPSLHLDRHQKLMGSVQVCLGIRSVAFV